MNKLKIKRKPGAPNKRAKYLEGRCVDLAITNIYKVLKDKTLSNMEKLKPSVEYLKVKWQKDSRVQDQANVGAVLNYLLKDYDPSKPLGYDPNMIDITPPKDSDDKQLD